MCYNFWSLFPIAGCNPVGLVKWGGWPSGSIPSSSTKFCSYRLMVRSLDFQSGNTGSIPVGSTNNGCVGERLIPADCKSAASGYGGSNPSASTIYSRIVKWYNGRLITGYYKFDSCSGNQF